MTPEASLLLLCSRTVLGPQERTALPGTIERVQDWDGLAALAARHGVSPLLHRHLGDCPSVPTATRALLWARHEARSRRNEALARELARIVRTASQAGIDVVPYKGPTLAVLAYGDLALREFGDLDLLVRPSDVLRLSKLLEPHGYLPEYTLPPHLERMLVRSPRHYELPLRDDRRGFVVELHWRADPDLDVARVDDPQWRPGLESVQLAGERMKTLAARELMLVLCLHGTKHAWSSLGWLVDIVELERAHPALDWDWVLAKARGLGAGPHLSLGLELAQRVLGVAWTPKVAAFLLAHDVGTAAVRIERGLFEACPPRIEAPAFVAGRARLQRGAAARTRFLIRIAFTPGLGEWQRWPLPESLTFLYWLLRPLRLAEKYVLRRNPPGATPRTPPPRPRSTG